MALRNLETIVLVMLENRSFTRHKGWHDDGPTLDRCRCHSDLRSRALAPKSPGDIVAMHDSRNLFADLTLEHRPPR